MCRRNCGNETAFVINLEPRANANDEERVFI